jgi:hypothetical protein
MFMNYNAPQLGKYVKHRNGKIYENRGYDAQTVDIISMDGGIGETVSRFDIQGPITANEEVELRCLYPSIEI